MSFFPAESLAKSNSSPPRLVVVIVIDQFRADYLTRLKDRFLPPLTSSGEVGGFNYLIKKGAYYPFAQYELLQCVTAPGHAAIATGTYSYLNGIVANRWYDRASRKTIQSISDDQHGESPKNLLAPTVGDELKLISPSSKIASVALKDRSSILLGGRLADIAIWFDKKAFSWKTSTYYSKGAEVPDQIKKLNADLGQRRKKTYTWKAVPESPVPYDSEDALSYPLGVELTFEAARKLMDQFQLGQDKVPDVLFVSLSSHDMLGHKLGPNRSEMTEMTLAEDGLLSKFLNILSKRVPGGLGSTLVVLTADHGVASSISNLSASKLDTGHINMDTLEERIEKRLDEKFGESNEQKWIAAANSFNFYLDQGLIEKRKLDRQKIETEIKNELLTTPGILTGVTRSEYVERKLPVGPFEKMILKSYHLDRSPDVIAIPRPFYFNVAKGATHISGYSYDRTVPLILAGPGVRAGRFARTPVIADIAPTLSYILGIVPPAFSEGSVLHEAVD